MKKNINNLKEMEDFALFIINSKTNEGVADRATVLGLSGDLGSGKTTFAQYFGKGLGVNENISSPTFVVSKKYDIDFNGFKKFIHIDAYRLDGDHDVENIGLKSQLESPENIILIEWPEMLNEQLPKISKIDFRYLDKDTRIVKF